MNDYSARLESIVPAKSLQALIFMLLVAFGLPELAGADPVMLEWDRNPESQVAGYECVAGLQAGFSRTGAIIWRHDVGNVTACIFPDAVPGTRYYFAVRAYFAGPVYGPYSGEVTGFGNAGPALQAPSNRTGTVGVATSLQLVGSDPDGPVVYAALGLPPGLSLTASTGFIAGTPSTPGTYLVTVTVLDISIPPLIATRTFTWTINPPADTTDPTVSITSPTSASTFSTTAASLVVSGTAGDNVGVAQVTWANDRGGSGTASGTTSWSAGAITLQSGDNVITVTAFDAAGNSRTDVLTITQASAPGSLPSGWSSGDVAAPAVSGATTFSGGTFTVRGAGVDIWDTSDQFRFAYQQVTGDIEIVSRVVSITNTHEWAKAGVMLRESLTGPSPHIALVATPGQGMNLYRRPTAGAVTQGTPTSSSTAPFWVRLERRGSTVTAYQSSTGTAWTSVGTMTLASSTAYVGLVVTSHDPAVAATGVFDNVVVRSLTNVAPTASLTAPASGSTFTAPATVTVSASASDSDGTVAEVEFFAGSTSLGADTTSPYSVTWNNVAAGSYSLTAVARDSSGATTTSTARTITVTAPNQPPTAALTAPASGATFTAPANITVSATATDSDGTIARVEFFAGSTLIGTDTASPFSVTWSNVAAGSYSLTARSTDNDGDSTTSAARTISVTGTGGLPTEWTAADVGGPSVAGSTMHAGGTFTVRGAGIDIWDTSDQFQFVYQQLTGDVEIISRVASISNTHEWAKAGVMVRQSLTGASPHISLVATPGQGINLYRRSTTGATTTGTPTDASPAPFWVRLERRGSVVTAYQSSNGTNWTSVGTMTLTSSTVYVGLVVTSHDPAVAATGVVDNVVARMLAGNTAPTASLTAPSSGATFTAPASITVSANATDSDGTIARVDFFAGSTLIGTDTSSPFSVTWSNVAAGSYSLTARSTDNDGDSTTSAARTVTVTAPANQAPTAALTAPSSGATFTAPASITVSATATDSDGTIARVEFFAGSTLIGTDTSSPFSMTWSNVSVGTYSLTARSTDDDGASTTSTARTVTVNGSVPAGWTAGDIGSPAIAGSTTHASGTFTVRGAGVDIWGTSDEFQFVYQQVTGDVSITARVASLGAVNEWSKALVMVRGSLAANAVNVATILTAQNGFSFQRRTSTGGTTTSTLATGAVPAWVRLEKRGTTITGFRSTNGTTWTSMGSVTLTLPSTYYVGLAVTSHDEMAATTATLDNVSVLPIVPEVVTTISTAPASGSGMSQTFALQYSNTLGSTAVAQAWAWFNAAMTATSANSCLVYYDQPSNQLRLQHDDGSAWLSGTLGGSGTLQNSQCTLALGSSSIARSGSTLTVNVAMTFKSAFGGAKNIYMYAGASSGANSGWQDRGDWTVPGGTEAIAVDGTTPSGGSGATQTFALRYSNSLGATGVAQAWVWFNATMAATSASSCLIYYDQASNQLRLQDNAGVAWMSGAPGASATLQNSQCALALGSSTITRNGTQLTVNIAVTFKTAFRGGKNIYMYASAPSGANTGWLDHGDWTVP